MAQETVRSNGAWTMMLDAAISIEALEATNSKIGNDLVQVHGELELLKQDRARLECQLFEYVRSPNSDMDEVPTEYVKVDSS